MFSITASMALVVSLAILPHFSTQADVRFCKDGTCPMDQCPVFTHDLGPGFPVCTIFKTDDLLGGKDFAAAEAGGYSVFLDIPQPDPTCTIIIRSPASVDVQGCGTIVGAFKNAGCVGLVLKESFMAQFCCGSGDCSAAGVSKKMIRGLNYARAGSLIGSGFRDASGATIEPIEVGEPPEWKSSWKNGRRAIGRRDDCNYTPDGDIFTTNGPTQIIMTGVDGGTAGSEVKITQERSVSRSTTFEAGVGFEVFSASVSITFEETLTDGEEKTFTIPAGQVGKLGFTPIWKCTKGSLDCGNGASTGQACTGYREAGEIAGTYAVIAIT